MPADPAELPHWPADIGTVFPVHALSDALLAVYNPHTVGAGLRWDDLAILAAWGAAGKGSPWGDSGRQVFLQDMP